MKPKIDTWLSDAIEKVLGGSPSLDLEVEVKYDAIRITCAPVLRNGRAMIEKISFMRKGKELMHFDVAYALDRSESITIDKLSGVAKVRVVE